MNAEDAPTYVVTCLYGLEQPLADEVRQRLGAEAERHWCETVFPFEGPADRLRELRVGVNVFLRLGVLNLGPAAGDLEALAAQLQRFPLDRWARRWAEFNGSEPPSPDISVGVDRKGDHRFTYKDVEQVALDTLMDATGRKTTLDPRPLQLRVEINQERCRLTGRLSAEPLSKRPYKGRHWPSETDPTLAAAMVLRSRPREDDAFLDPFCGTGTIPIERALTGPAGRIVAGEIQPKRLGLAAVNVAAAGAAIPLTAWDAHALPFQDRVFTRIVTNPPQGNPATGRPWQPVELARLLAESLRVLDRGCPMVLLARRELPLREALKRIGGARVAGRLVCDWKGRPCDIYTVRVSL